MKTSRPILTFAALGCGILLLSACSSAGDENTSAPDSSVASGAPVAGSAGSGSDSGSSFTVADVAARYPDCAAIGAVLGDAVAGLDADASNSVADDAISCAWVLPIGGDASRPATVGVAIDPNSGAADVPTPDTLAMISAEQVPNAAIESSGGIAYMTQNGGDLRVTVTLVDVPGVTASITQGALGTDPTFVGPSAVAAMSELLGIG